MGENTGKLKTFSVPVTKEVTRIDKNAKEKYKNHEPFTIKDYHLLIAEDLWQAHYELLLIILLKEFIELNWNIDMAVKNASCVELNAKIVSGVLNIQMWKMI